MTGAELESDPDLVRRARAGEQRALTLLVGKHKLWLHRFVRRYVGDADEAQDVVQDAFVAALANLHRYDVDRPFEAWLRRIALNKCRDRARREAVRRAFGLSRRGPSEIEAAVDPSARADDRIGATAALSALEHAVAALPAGLKDALILTALEGLSQKDAGALLGLSAKAVEVRVYRAKRILVEALSRDVMGDLLDPPAPNPTSRRP